MCFMRKIVFTLKWLTALLLIAFANQVFSQENNQGELIGFENNDFIIVLPKATQFIQKAEQVEEQGKKMNAYLFEPDTEATKNETPMKKNVLSSDPYLYASVVILPREVKDNEAINAQRLFIGIANAGNKEAMGLKVDPKDFYHIQQFSKKIWLNKRNFQTYEFVSDKGKIAYYTFMTKDKLYFFQAYYLAGKEAQFNDEMLRRSLDTLVLK